MRDGQTKLSSTRPHSATVRLEYGKTWDHYDFNLSLDGRALSQVKTNQYTSNDPNAGTEKVTYPGYTMWNLTLTQRVWKGINVNMAVNNLFNEDYLSVLSRPMPGINFEFFIGITPKFGKSRK